ncbi:MAG: hypothetical protein ACKO9I_06890 [Sphaerospermopsis kisseleviana]
MVIGDWENNLTQSPVPSLQSPVSSPQSPVTSTTFPFLSEVPNRQKNL